MIIVGHERIHRSTLLFNFNLLLIPQCGFLPILTLIPKPELFFLEYDHNKYSFIKINQLQETPLMF